MSLPKPDDFDAFYHGIHGNDPFPWQSRLAGRVCAGDWPRAIALPTAAGKTACIDIAVFALACRAKDAPRRIFFVVDRRIVVDQAFDHAKKLARVLDRANDGVLRSAADALREIALPGWATLSSECRQQVLLKRWEIQDETDSNKRQKLVEKLTREERALYDISPLDVYALRGGMYRESAWARSPLQPTVIASTVDQVGSRLLFRGYGVSDSMKPIHAGLVGNDAIILLDEAHCAKPFDETVGRIEKYRAWGEPTSPPFKFVSITATPREGVEKFEANPEDLSHPVLGERIKASKPAKLLIADKAKGKKATGELVEVLKSEAEKLYGKDLGLDAEGNSHTLKCVGIIVNRVATARELAAKLGEDAVLLTGRMRPLDRDRLFEEKLRPLLSNAEGTPPKFVVGTQCLECGADFDFHALVTECASLDALRQRFGRLNRVANRPNAPAVVVVRGDQTEPKEKENEQDPVYGNSLANTWKWLNEKATDGVFDFGVAAVKITTDGVNLEPLNAPTSSAPVLFPAHLDCWVQTNPIPTPDPDPALFLHGPKQPGQPDVQVVFRNDLGNDPTQWAEVVGLCPPSSSEAVAVPIGVFKKWLAGDDAKDDTADVEAGPADEPTEEVVRKALRWRGPEKSSIVDVPKDVTPECVYVLPCEADGAGTLGDFPYGLTDYAEPAFQKSRDKAVLRLTTSKLSEDAEDFDEVLTEEIKTRLADDSPEWLQRAVSALINAKKREVEPHPLGGWVVTGKKRLCQFDPTYLDDGEPAESYRGGRAVKLKEHSAGVARFARRFAEGCGLPVKLYSEAGFWHDLGKLDPRFQAMLKQSSPQTAVGVPLAKSARSPRTKEDRDAARQVHRYPVGARHELLSAAMLQGADELVLHLIATHHGSGRPFAEPVEENAFAKKPFVTKLFDKTFRLDTSAQEIAVWNGELPERFWRIVRKFGWWGSAYREAVFRLADHAQSRLEQELDAEPTFEAVAPPPVHTGAEPQRLHPLALPGLDGANPLGFLAALGTLRLTEELLPGSRLRWEVGGNWYPVLETPTALTGDELVTLLHRRVARTGDGQSQERLKSLDKKYAALKKQIAKALEAVKGLRLRGAERDAAIKADVSPLVEQAGLARSEWLTALEAAAPAPFLTLGKALRVTTTEFADFATRTAEVLIQRGPTGRTDADFVTAFGCEGAFDTDGYILPTDLQLISGSGHQYFLETFAKLMRSVTANHLSRSLFHTWTYADPGLSFRWDPIDDKRYAVNWDDPSSLGVKSEQGANLLAAFALPLFPVCPVRRTPKTTGFRKSTEWSLFTWPLWTRSLSCDVVRSFLSLPSLHAKNRIHWNLRAIGIEIAYQVRKFEVGKAPTSKWNLCPSSMV